MSGRRRHPGGGGQAFFWLCLLVAAGLGLVLAFALGAVGSGGGAP